MKLGKVDNIILFGGSPILAEFAIYLKNSGKYSVSVFSCDRQLKEPATPAGESLGYVLKKKGISFYTSEDVCQDEKLNSLITSQTMGLGFGEVWTFDKTTIDKFGGKLFDFMGIPLPQYRGGAHYSWLIMRKNKKWACNVQIINEDMVQGVFDSGGIIKNKEYAFSTGAKVPQDYFDEAGKTELEFLKEFLLEIENDKDFSLVKMDEDKSIYFPRLYTLKHGFINWAWNAEDIVSFADAFDDPYAGISTFLGGRRVFLKKCYSEFKDGEFHPFQVGLIYKINEEGIYVAATNGTVIVKEVTEEDGNSIKSGIAQGERFFTPQKNIEESMQYNAVYDAKGIVLLQNLLKVKIRKTNKVEEKI
jgi:formyl transferase-like protein